MHGHPSLYPSLGKIKMRGCPAANINHTRPYVQNQTMECETHTPLDTQGLKCLQAETPIKPENAWDTLHLDQMAWGKETRHLYSPRFHTAKSSTNKNTHRQTSARWKTWKWELGSSSLKQFWARTMRAQPRWRQDSIAELMAHAASGGLGPPLSTHRKQAEDSISNHRITCSQCRQPDQSTKNSRVGIQSQSS